MVHTAPSSPYWVPLASPIASSSSENRLTVSTGPKTSSWAISRCRVDAGDHGGREVGAVGQRRDRAGAHRRRGVSPLALPLDHRLHPPLLLAGDQRPEVVVVDPGPDGRRPTERRQTMSTSASWTASCTSSREPRILREV